MSQKLSKDEINTYLLSLATRSDLDLWTHTVNDMAGPRQIFVLIWELESEVNNGGFQQYFHNSSGEGAHLCVEALKTLGAEATAELVERAIDVFGTTTAWQDDAKRQSRANSLDQAELESLNDLDQAFYKYEDNLSVLLFKYVKCHMVEFPL